MWWKGDFEFFSYKKHQLKNLVNEPVTWNEYFSDKGYVLIKFSLIAFTLLFSTWAIIDFQNERLHETILVKPNHYKFDANTQMKMLL